MTNHRQLPRLYIPYALLTMFGPLLIMLLRGDAIHPSAAGLAFVALLLLWFAHGSLMAWMLLLGWNVFVTFAVAAASGGGSSAGDGWVFPSAPLLLLLGLISTGMLLTPSMRRHVGVGRPRTSGPHQPAH